MSSKVNETNEYAIRFEFPRFQGWRYGQNQGIQILTTMKRWHDPFLLACYGRRLDNFFFKLGTASGEFKQVCPFTIYMLCHEKFLESEDVPAEPGVFTHCDSSQAIGNGQRFRILQLHSKIFDCKNRCLCRPKGVLRNSQCHEKLRLILISNL